MSTITTRAAKGSALTHAEVDANFTNLNTGKAEVSGQTFTGNVVLPAGSATAGGVQVGTGTTYKPAVYSPGADQLAISTGGTGRLFVDASGRVGLGSSTVGPAYIATLTGNGTSIVGGFQLNSNGNITCLGATGATTTDFEIWNSANGFLRFATNNTERLRIDSSGNLGVGVTSPATASFGNVIRNRAPAGSGASGYFAEGANSDTWFGIYSGTGTSDSAALVYPSTGSLRIATTTGVGVGGFSEKIRIDSSGRLLVGTSSSRSNWYNTTGLDDNLQIEGTTHGGSGFSIVRSNNSGGHIEIGSHGGTTIGSYALVSSSATLGSISFQGANGTEFVEAASIYTAVDGTPGANNMPGRLVFSTTASGSATSTERVRIDSSGRVLVGLTSANTSGAKLQTVDGLTFPATQVASADPNTLDDYEEGTFTPVVIGSTSAGTATYSTQFGIYTKIGRLVTVTIFLGWSSGTGTGNFQITGLPFTALNSTGSYFPASIGYVDAISLTAGNYILGHVAQGTSRIDFIQSPTGGGSQTSVPYDAAGVVMVSSSYCV